jgi:gamma-glutamylcyclotransferase (GGCT)/AIG2-like uncharacterized protein YtfP
MNEFLFVYGTLMQSRQHKMHQLLAKHAVLQGNGYIQAKLYQISSYPGVIESNHEQDKVYGELYLLRRPRWLLAQLDEYECCSPVFAEPHEYVRKSIDVVLSNHQIQSAWVYVYNYPVKAEQQIKSGRFI